MNKFNIIIPTRERADTLFWTLKTCQEQEYENIDIWVSDNCSTDNTKEIVKSFKDQRIHYLKTDHRVSMTHNWEFALSHVREGFVLFLGDDDGLVPGAVGKLSKLIDKYKVEAIMWTRHYYHWPNFIIPELQNKLLINLDEYLKINNSKQVLNKALKEFNFWILPNVYHGIVSLERINSFKSKHGKFFHSVIPDIFSTFVLAHEIETFIHSALPFSIVGYSRMSNGATFLEGATDSKGIPLINSFEEDIIPFHNKLENCISGSVLFAEPYFQAKKLIPELPDLSIKKVLTMAFNNAYIQTRISKENYDNTMSALEKIALKNNEMPLFNSLKSKHKHIKKQPYGITTGFDSAENIFILDLGPLNLTTIYDASKIIGQLRSALPAETNYNPILLPLITYFKSGFYFLLKKLLKRFYNLPFYVKSIIHWRFNYR